MTGVTRALDLGGERAVHQPAGVACAAQRHLDDASHQRTDSDRGGRVTVEPAQLALVLKTREPLMPAAQRPLGHRRRGRSLRRPGAVSDDHRAPAAEARERAAVLPAVPAGAERERAGAHDWLEVRDHRLGVLTTGWR